MNKRTFLSQFLKGAIIAAASPQIITSGLGLYIPRKRITRYAFPKEITQPNVISGYRYRVCWEREDICHFGVLSGITKIEEIGPENCILPPSWKKLLDK